MRGLNLRFQKGDLLAVAAALLLAVAVFFLVSGGLLAMLWPLVRKYINPQVTATNVDSVIGSTGRVTVAIDNVNATGQVKLGSMEWTARSTYGYPIPAGTLVRVDKIEGVKAIVSPIQVYVNH